VKNIPPYAIRSVDNALHLAAVLAQEGPLRLSEAAERLGVAKSTAHRLLGMLVYRDFAEQDEDRRYVAGPVLRRAVVPEPVAALRRIALPHLRALADEVNETTNLVVVVGSEARFVASAECSQTLRVGDRAGRVLPAHRASGGRAILATLPEEQVRSLYSGVDPPVDVEAVLRDLRRVRRRGYAVNDQATELGVTAVGLAIPPPPDAGTASPGGVSISLPTLRHRRDRLPGWVGLLRATADRITQELTDV
jgi:IclR family acetate operon transcriptional repressor